jgi:hypothetical protein
MYLLLMLTGKCRFGWKLVSKSALYCGLSPVDIWGHMWDNIFNSWEIVRDIMLKYANVAIVGDKIRAYDFEPIPGRPDRFVEGVVSQVDTIQGADVFVIYCTADSSPEQPGRVGMEMYIPHELGFDWDGRVQLVEEV